jgi:hypothetical protein
LTGEIGAKKAGFEFLPPLTLDGTYIIEVRGVDVFGNASIPKTVEFVIDQLPPTVGGGVISYGALPLYATDGVVTVMEGVEYEVVLYENGGADQVNLVINNNQYSITKMGINGLWRGVVKFAGTGEFISIVKARDGAGNETEREWVKFNVVPRGKVNAESIRVFWLDPTTKRYQLWDGGEYGVDGRSSIVDGRWGYVLPKGDYYLEAEKDGVKTISQKISLENTMTIISDWEIGQASWWERIFKIRRMVNLKLDNILTNQQTSERQMQVVREKWIGKRSVVIIGTSELPWYSETLRRAGEWASREGAQVVKLEEQGVDDPKGEWLPKLSVGLLPQVYLIDAKGDTQDMKEGVWER